MKLFERESVFSDLSVLVFLEEASLSGALRFTAALLDFCLSLKAALLSSFLILQMSWP